MPFEGDVVIRQVTDREFELDEPITYRGARDSWVIPARQRTDLTSVPWGLTWLVPKYGRFTKASILHDALCRRSPDLQGPTVPRWQADGIYRRVLRELGVSFLRRWMMWAAVRVFSSAILSKPAHVPGLLVMTLLFGAFVAVPLSAVLVFMVLFWVLEVIAVGLEWGFNRVKRPERRVNVPVVLLRCDRPARQQLAERAA